MKFSDEAARWRDMCHCIETCQPQPVVAGGRIVSTASLPLLEIGKRLNHAEQRPGGCRIGGSKDWATKRPQGAECLRCTKSASWGGRWPVSPFADATPRVRIFKPLNASQLPDTVFWPA